MSFGKKYLNNFDGIPHPPVASWHLPSTYLGLQVEFYCVFDTRLIWVDAILQPDTFMLACVPLGWQAPGMRNNNMYKIKIKVDQQMKMNSDASKREKDQSNSDKEA